MSQAGIIDFTESDPEVPVDFVTDNGTATAIANTIEILGSGIVDTAGSGNVITVNAPELSISTNSGTATSAAHAISVLGGGTVTTSGSGSTVTVTGSNSLPFIDQGTSITVASQTGYFVTAAATLTLPSSPTQGNIISIVVDTTGTVTVQANAGQKIRMGAVLSATAGKAVNLLRGDCLTLVYRSSGATWFVNASMGNWTVT